jgi:hypothetical protein
MVHDLYLVQVKTPQESKNPWDFVKVAASLPPDQAFRPLDRKSTSPVIRPPASGRETAQSQSGVQCDLCDRE